MSSNTTSESERLPYIVTHRLSRAVGKDDLAKLFKVVPTGLQCIECTSHDYWCLIRSTWDNEDAYRSHVATFNDWLTKVSDSPRPIIERGHRLFSIRRPERWGFMRRGQSGWNYLLVFVAVLGTVEAIRNHFGWTFACAYVEQVAQSVEHDMLVGEPLKAVPIEVRNTSRTTTAYLMIDLTKATVEPAQGLYIQPDSATTFPAVKPGESVAVNLHVQATNPGLFAVTVPLMAKGGEFGISTNRMLTVHVNAWNDCEPRWNEASVVDFDSSNAEATIELPVRFGKTYGPSDVIVSFKRWGSAQVVAVDMAHMVTVPTFHQNSSPGSEMIWAEWSTSAISAPTEAKIVITVKVDTSWSKQSVIQKLRDASSVEFSIQEKRQ